MKNELNLPPLNEENEENDTLKKLLISKREEDPFGSRWYFKKEYRESLKNFLPNYLEQQISEIISKSKDDEEMKVHLITLAEVYFEVRKEFDKNNK